MIDWTEILLALIGLVGVIISAVAVPYLRANTTEKQRENLEYWVDVAITAAEKHFEESGAGPAKKAEVKKFIESMGLPATDEQLDKLITSGVERLINKPWREFTGVNKL